MHDYKVTAKYGYATFYKCNKCDVAKHYSWSPGWPGSTSYYVNGDEVQNEPKCVTLPLDEIIMAVGDIDNWSLASPLKHQNSKKV
jgi:hypothetical protein